MNVWSVEYGFNEMGFTNADGDTGKVIKVYAPPGTFSIALKDENGRIVTVAGRCGVAGIDYDYEHEHEHEFRLKAGHPN